MDTNTILWIAQILLGLVFLMAGAMKIIIPKEKFVESQEWAASWQPNAIKALGAVEVAGAIGLVAPLALDILPFLTPLAAIGLVLVMAGAAFTHLTRKEYPNIGINAVLMIIAVVIFVGRLPELQQVLAG